MQRYSLPKDMFRDWRTNKAIVVHKESLTNLRDSNPSEELADDECIVSMRHYLEHVLFTTKGPFILLDPGNKTIKAVRHSPLTSEPRVKKSVQEKTPILKHPAAPVATKKYVKPENCSCQQYVFVNENRKPIPKPVPAIHHPTCFFQGKGP